MGKTPNIDLDAGKEDTSSESEVDDKKRKWNLTSKLNKEEKKKLEQSARERRARGNRSDD